MVTTVTLAGGGEAILEDDARFGEEGRVLLRFETGRQVLIPRSALLQEGGLYRLPSTAQELTGGTFGTDVGEQTQVMSQPLTESADGTVVVPLIVSILEEVLVVEKRLMLKEEVRIARTQTEVHQLQVVMLRAEEAVVEGITADAAPAL